MKVGFIGLGTMGRHMASNLMKGGHQLAVLADEIRFDFQAIGQIAAVADLGNLPKLVRGLL